MFLFKQLFDFPMYRSGYCGTENFTSHPEQGARNFRKALYHVELQSKTKLQGLK